MKTVVSVAAMVGLVAGAVAGAVGPVDAPARGAATAGVRSEFGAVRVTSVDLLGTDRLEVTLRLTNDTATAVRYDAGRVALLVDAVTVEVHAPRHATGRDIRPGVTVEETLTFDAPPTDADVALLLPGSAPITVGT